MTCTGAVRVTDRDQGAVLWQQMVKVIQPLTATHAIGPRCDSESGRGSQRRSDEPRAPSHLRAAWTHRLIYQRAFAAMAAVPFMHAQRCDGEWRRREGDRPDALPPKREASSVAAGHLDQV